MYEEKKRAISRFINSLINKQSTYVCHDDSP